jgi:hypothetical protein
MFYLFLFAHLVADFVLQPFWLVQRKRRWDGLLIHVAVVLACMLALALIEPAAAGLWPAMLGITALHLAADRWKVRHADALLRPPVVPFLVDQAIHVGVLAVVLGLFVPPEALWDLRATPLARPALFGSGYLAAALATPIALIVLFDPRFAHAASAAGARLRCLLVATVVFALALFGGPLAMPFALAGIAAAASRPASAHPLDAPLGLLVVALGAASVGTLLALL